MKKPAMKKQQSLNTFAMQHPPVAAHFHRRLRLLVSATIASYGGMTNMNLNHWRSAEQKIKRGLENEQ
jgi:hypothetical protein